ncbi:MAG: hypothetical protein P8M34_15055 [Saprospiraceae bacterium]|nr:hypothetical protein [Saprospiraceae bacterium]
MKYLLASLLAVGLMGGVLIAKVKPLNGSNTTWCSPTWVSCPSNFKKCTCATRCPYKVCPDPSDGRRVIEDREKSSNS